MEVSFVSAVNSVNSVNNCQCCQFLSIHLLQEQELTVLNLKHNILQQILKNDSKHVIKYSSSLHNLLGDPVQGDQFCSTGQLVQVSFELFWHRCTLPPLRSGWHQQTGRHGQPDGWSVCVLPGTSSALYYSESEVKWTQLWSRKMQFVSERFTFRLVCARGNQSIWTIWSGAMW